MFNILIEKFVYKFDFYCVKWVFDWTIFLVLFVCRGKNKRLINIVNVEIYLPAMVEIMALRKPYIQR